MQNNFPTQSRYSLLANLLILIGMVAFVGAVFQLCLGVPIGMWMTGTDFTTFSKQFMASPQNYQNAWWAMMLLQGFTSFGSFVLAPYLFWKFVENQPITSLGIHPVPLIAYVLAGLAVLAMMPTTSWVYTLNHAVQLPEWMGQMEEKLETLTKFLTNFPGLAGWLLALGVIAVIPAIGEELLFRGLIQNYIERSTRNVHVAVWVSAAVFSAYHFQFYGFLPRLMLGVLFGYLFVFTRNIWVPIFAHFVNNGFTLLMLYLKQEQLTNIELEKTPNVPILAVLFSLLMTGALLFSIKAQNTTK